MLYNSDMNRNLHIVIQDKQNSHEDMKEVFTVLYDEMVLSDKQYQYIMKHFDASSDVFF